MGPIPYMQMYAPLKCLQTVNDRFWFGDCSWRYLYKIQEKRNRKTRWKQLEAGARQSNEHGVCSSHLIIIIISLQSTDRFRIFRYSSPSAARDHVEWTCVMIRQSLCQPFTGETALTTTIKLHPIGFRSKVATNWVFTIRSTQLN